MATGNGYHPAAPTVNAGGAACHSGGLPRTGMTDFMEPVEIFHVKTEVVGCDGGGGPLGHPLVYLNLSRKRVIECPYCSRRYVLDEGAGGAGH